ncbi:MAG: ABC transporter ATP-binding protein/permease [Alphaproteobacteria bacterium]|nr:ABC transporter ATP-binding protein/permease [Alphaproteobacteria bacterium]
MSPPRPPEESRAAMSNKDRWRTVHTLMPYLWPEGQSALRRRVMVALGLLILAKVVTITVPFMYAWTVDALQPGQAYQGLFVAIGLILAYGVARIMMQAFAQLRDAVFAKVAFRAVREVAIKTFRHIHALSLRFHLEKRTGGLNRIIERGTKGIDSLLYFALFSIFPTILELALVTVILLVNFNPLFAITTVGTIVVYGWFTIVVTERRTAIRRAMNDSDTDANTKAVDSLLNYETVKYFNNEEHEARRFGVAMDTFARASEKSQTSLSFLNTGQAAIIAVGLTIVMGLAAWGIDKGTMTLGDLILVNGFLVQLYVPLNLLGTVYRELNQAIVDMEKMFDVLNVPPEVTDKPGAPPLVVTGGAIEFDNVVFAYEPERTILKGISFKVAPGETVAVVGPSGAGKSTLSRILYRFYDIKSGTVRIDGQDLRDVTQDSVRAQIGIVPQDTVLFNDTVAYNIRYGRTGATDAEVQEAARHAQIAPFIAKLPLGYDAMVGERGLKLSGGEKQRVAIARTILKNPPILLLDEATSALDTHTEREIQQALEEISRDRTSLVIAHRLSTVVDADQILVLVDGQIVERGRHHELLARDGVYAGMWNRQREAAEARDKLTEAFGKDDPLTKVPAAAAE